MRHARPERGRAVVVEEYRPPHGRVGVFAGGVGHHAAAVSTKGEHRRSVKHSRATDRGVGDERGCRRRRCRRGVGRPRRRLMAPTDWDSGVAGSRSLSLLCHCHCHCYLLTKPTRPYNTSIVSWSAISHRQLNNYRWLGPDRHPNDTVLPKVVNCLGSYIGFVGQLFVYDVPSIYFMR